MPIRDIGPFQVSYLQVLDEHGNVDEALDPQLPERDLVRLYRSMWLAREGDQRMLKLQRQGRVGTFGPCSGQEASACGPALAMTERDWLVGAFRELGAWLMRGVPLANVYLFHNGWEEGNVAPAAPRTLPISIIVGAQLPQAVGIAYAMRYRDESGSAVVTYVGDGGTSQGDTHEALNFAAVWKAPVVFVCQNNQWAISMPRSRQTRSRTLAQKAIAYDMPGIQVDGNDALAMYRVTREALDRAHAGEGPTFIEAVTYRLLPHTTSDDPRRYRSEEEEQEWWKREPLIRFRVYLERKGIWNADRQAAMEEEVKAEVEAAVRELESRKEFPPDAPFEHVFGTPHETIAAQRTEFLREREAEVARG